MLHLGFEDPRRPGAGGGSVRTHEINRRLAARGVEVTVMVAPWPGATATVRDGVRYVPLPAHLGPLVRSRFASQIAYFAAIVTRLGGLTRRYDPDVIVEDFAARPGPAPPRLSATASATCRCLRTWDRWSAAASPPRSPTSRPSSPGWAG
ncbi:glycosyltransferase family 4 protein [Streptomyces griseocarneus]|uniref:glycosyltransferase family 4 protein n=1 Tax=Streptomyces griseocarneus TaxID=51201 RepID=UPI003FD8BA58